MAYEALLAAQQHQHRPMFGSRHGERLTIERLRRVGEGEAIRAMDKVEVQDDGAEGSGSVSGHSDLSALDNDTDTFGRELLRHERDARRLQDALRGEPRAFARARPRHRVAVTIDEADADRGLAGIMDQEHQRVGSSGSNESDPPLNVPREWGRRARPQKGWMRKIREPSEGDISVHVENDREEAEAPKPDEDAIVPRRTAYTGDDYWSPTGDDALPSVEDTPPSMRQPRPVSQPTSLRHMNSTLRQIMEAEDQDFDDASILASTPANSKRQTRLAELTRREIDSLQRQGVTTRALDQITERSPHEGLRHRASSRTLGSIATNDTANANEHSTRPLTAPSGETAAKIIRRRSLITNKENIPVNGTTGSHFKSVETVLITDRTAQAVSFKKPQRPGHTRQDSINILKRLARVSSLSPSPAKEPTSKEEADNMLNWGGSIRDEEVAASQSARTTERNAARRPASTKSSSEKSADDEARDEAKKRNDEAESLPTPEGTPDIDVTPAHPQSGADAKTPVVTGAWVDTPGPTTDLRPLLQTTDSTIVRAFGTPSGAATLMNRESDESPLDANIRRIHSEPLRGKSALEELLQEARSHPDGQLGDTTIQSLEDIVHPNLDPTDTTLTIDTPGRGQEAAENLDDGPPLSQAAKDRRQEDLAIEAMDKHLRVARTSIKDADRGLRRVENRIESSEVASSDLPTPQISTTITKVTHTVVGHSGRTQCAHCGGRYTSVWRGLWTEFRENFYTYDPSYNRHFGIKFTRLGALLAAFLIWFFVETVLGIFFCQPELCSRGQWCGTPFDPGDQPEFPYVIPTLVFRPSRPLWLPLGIRYEWAKDWVDEIIYGPENEHAPFAFHARLGWDGKLRPRIRNWTPTEWPEYDDPELTRLYARQRTARTVATAGFASATASASTTARATATATRVGKSILEALDEVGSMWDDEKLQ